ncbi:hypothetical protein BT69DRAFT_1277085 [Atractiella rhizophila]|nr:hypothetical protein BT69DRAFT_1277085 [Atractiella rhizophila]
MAPKDKEAFRTTKPSAEELEKASKLEVFDEDGNKVTLGSLFEHQKTAVVWIRHFYCGMCQQYVQAWTDEVKASVLEEAGVKLVFIGCGDYKLIKPYRSLLSTPYAIYADPTKSTYIALGMTLRTLEKGEDPTYLKKRGWAGIKDSIFDGLSMGLKYIGKQGDMKQLGGDFIFGPGLQCHYTNRMLTTRDHTEVKDLAKELGIEIS